MAEEPEESLYDVLFSKLELPEIFGQLTATSLLLSTLILTLLEAHTLKTSQVETALTRAFADLAATFEGMADNDPDRAEEIKKMRIHGERILSEIRSRFIDDPQKGA